MTACNPTAMTRLRRMIAGRYDVVTEHVKAGNETFSILRIRDSNRLLDQIDPASFAQDERLPYWADLWDSSICLAGACLQNSRVPRARILELGCGLGLAGIAAAKAGGVVTMTDYEQDALLFARYNTSANLGPTGCEGSCTFRLLDWRNPGADAGYDIILGADIVYERRSFVPVLSLFQRWLVPGGIALLADPNRRTAGEFNTMATAEGFGIERGESSVTRDGRTVPVTVFTLTRHGERSTT